MDILAVEAVQNDAAAASDASFIVSDRYPYSSGDEISYFYVELEHESGQSWDVTAQFTDDNSYTMTRTRSSVSIGDGAYRSTYLAEITGLTAGTYTVTLTARYKESNEADAVTKAVAKEVTLEPVMPDMGIQKWLNPGEGSLDFWVDIPSKNGEKVTGAKLVEHGNPDKVVGMTIDAPTIQKNYARQWGNYFRSIGFYFTILPDEINWICPYVSGTIKLSYKLSGSYDLIIETNKDGYTFENYAVSECPTSLITQVGIDARYDNTGAYIYVQLEGEALNTDGFYPVLKREDGTEITETDSAILVGSNYSPYTTFRLKKKANFPEGEEWVFCEFVSKDGYPEVQIQEHVSTKVYTPVTNSNNGTVKMVFNGKEKKYVLYTTSQMKTGTRIQLAIQKGSYPQYDSSTNSFSNVLATAAITVTGLETEVEFLNSAGEPYYPPANYSGDVLNYAASWEADGSRHGDSGTVSCYPSGFGTQGMSYSILPKSCQTGTEIPVTVNVFRAASVKDGDTLTATLTKESDLVATTQLTAAMNGTTAVFTGTFTSETAFDAGTYTVAVSDAEKGISSSATLYLFNDGDTKFYQTSQYAGSQIRNGELMSYLQVSLANAGALDKSKFKVEFFDLNKQPVTDVECKEIDFYETFDFVNFYYSDMAQKYTTLYAKVTYDDALGCKPHSSETYYSETEQTYGRLGTFGSGITFSYTNNVGYKTVQSFSIADYSVEVYDDRDGTPLASFPVTKIGAYNFTKKDLQPVLAKDPDLNKVYKLMAKKDGYIYATQTNVNINYDGNTQTEPVTPKEPTAVKLSQTSATLLKGSSLTLKATLTPADAASTLTWASDKPEVATVSNGVVTAVGEGEAKITVTTANNKTAACTVKVVDYALTCDGEPLTDDTPIQLKLTDKKTATLGVTRGDGSALSSTEKVSFRSYNPSVVTAAAVTGSADKGTITAVKGGTTTIVVTVTVNKVAVELTCKVSVTSEVTAIELLSGRTKLESDGDSDTLQVFITPADLAADTSVSWESSRPDIMTVTDSSTGNGTGSGTSNNVGGSTGGVHRGVVTTLPYDASAYGNSDVAEVTITAKVTSAITKQEIKAEWKYTVVKKDTVKEVPAGHKVYVVTNVDKTLGDGAVKAQLPEGWKWTEENAGVQLKSFAGVKEKTFTIYNENPVTKQRTYATVTVVFSTIDGITLKDADGNDVSKLAFASEDTGAASVEGAAVPPTTAVLRYTVSGEANNSRLAALNLQYNITLAKNAKADIVKWENLKKIENTETPGNPANLALTDRGAEVTLSGLKAGNTTLLLQVVSGETIVYEKQWKISAVDSKKKGLSTINAELRKRAADGSEGDLISAQTDKNGIVYYPISTPDTADAAKFVYLKNLTTGDCKLTYKSSDTTVIKIGKATKEEPDKIPLTIGSIGTAVLTVTADDTLKTTKEYLIRVTNDKQKTEISTNSISISHTTVTVNTALTESDAVIAVYNGVGGTLKSVAISGVSGSKLAGIAAEIITTATDGTETTAGTDAADGTGTTDGTDVTTGTGTSAGTATNEVRIYPIPGAAEAGNVKAGKAKLDVEIDAGGGTVLRKSFNITVKVTAKAPSVTVKQLDKVNTFYQDKPGRFSIGSPDGQITDVTLTQVTTTAAAMTKGSDYTFDSATGILSIEKVPEKTKKLNFSIEVAGYKTPVVKKNVAVSTETANFKLSATSGTVYTDSSQMAVAVKLLDKTTGLTVDLTNVNVTVTKADNKATGSYTPVKNADKLTLSTTAAPAAKGDKLTLRFESSNWNEAREFTYTVKPALLSKAALQIGQKTLTLYNYKKMAASTETTLTLKGGSELEELFTAGNLSIGEKVNNNLGASLDKTLKIAYADGSLKVSKNSEQLKAGTYKFDIALSGSYWKNPLKTTLNVKVVDVDMDNARTAAKAKVTAKGSIDVLNRKGTSVILTPKFTNVPKDARVTKVELTGTDAHLFTITGRNGNQAAIQLQEGVNVITKYQYRIQVSYTVQAGDTELTLTSEAVKIKLTQKKPKVKVSGGNVYSSTRSDGKTIRFALTNSVGASIDADRIVLQSAPKDFSYDTATGILSYTPRGTTARGKSYTLKFAVYPDGCGDNEKPLVVSYKVAIAK
ncbi:MAG: Ig-like domain-containing protein [Blautia sp.]|nr:Ig-like domain-containing protein [Lachnoclostridium sp.]MCM1211955.1 Ig-like domain-containing protein [Blautia sp.]